MMSTVAMPSPAVLAASSPPATVSPIASFLPAFRLACSLLLGVVPRHKRLTAKIVTPFAIDFYELYFNFITDIYDVRNFVYAVHIQMGNVDEPLLPGKEFYECSEIEDSRHLAFINRSYFRFHDNQIDDFDCLGCTFGGDGSYHNSPIIFNVNLGTGVFYNLRDNLSARADHRPYHVDRNLQRGQSWGELREGRARFADSLVHDAK